MINRIINFFKKKINDEFSIEKLNSFSIKPIFKKTLTEIYIERNIDYLLQEILNKFKEKNFILKIGVEIEFYLLDKNIIENDFYDEVKNFCKINNIEIENIEKERGQFQYEIEFKPYIDIAKLINDYALLKSFLLQNFNITFETFPFFNQPFSALQTNVNLVDENNKNLFAREDKNGEKNESKLLLNSIGGLLFYLNKFLKYYSNDGKDLIRYDLLINKILQKNGFVPAPTFISWGVNNRTSSIRIPVPKDLNDLKKYIENDNNSRRIEFRIASSNADLKFVIFCNLFSILKGINDNILPIEKTSYNVIEKNIGLKNIELEELKIYDII